MLDAISPLQPQSALSTCALTPNLRPSALGNGSETALLVYDSRDSPAQDVDHEWTGILPF